MSSRFFNLSLFASLLICIFNLFVDVMEIDAAQYAEMSMEMLQSGNYLEPTCLGRPYLDKPPLIFWLGAISFKLFGISNFAYKLPSLLFAILAVYSTYRFTLLFYDKLSARTAAVMLSISQAMFIATNDVRTDTLLMGAVIFSIWQWAAFFDASKTKYVIGAGIGLGLALLAKGPVGLIAVGFAIVPHLVWKKKWRLVFDWRLLLAILIVAVMLWPMCIGLYHQHGVKGLRFYFWTQSFGRITGESEWNNHPDPVFLLYTFAWKILPWTIFFFAGWYNAVNAVWKLRGASWSQKEFISLTGFTLMLASLMQSKYQLPHYVYVVLPMGSVLAARGFVALTSKNEHPLWIKTLQLLTALAALLSAVVMHVSFSNQMTSLLIMIGLCAAAVILMYKQRSVLLWSIAPFIAFNFLLSFIYMPALLNYQAGNDIGRAIKASEKSFITYKYINNYSLVFYAQQMPVKEIWEPQDLDRKIKTLAVTTQEGVETLNSNNIAYKVLLEKQNFAVSKLNLRFLNPELRKDLTEKNYLIEIYP